jgi:sulfonate transport system ATP-binding protein
MAKQLTVSISKKYYGSSGLCILKDCNLEAEKGEFVAILGESGCGKTTLLKSILGIDMNFSGEIFLGERLVESPRNNCAIVFQDLRLLPWMSVKNNIFYALDKKNEEHEEQIKGLLNLLDLNDFANKYPSSLSGGMAQKAALARALINVPDLLLLDEPFASLDYITKMRLQKELIDILSELNTTVLMVTHDIEEAIFVSDRILVMSPKPSKIIKSFDVDLKKPRDRSSEEFLQVYQEVLDYMTDVLHII